MFTALVGVIGFVLGHFTNLRKEQSEWRKDFRELYQQFWDSTEMGEVRAWLACDEGYKIIEPVLQRRLNGNTTLEDYAILEKLNRFSALLIRIINMNNLPASKEERVLWKELYFSFWLKKIHNRALLNAYMMECWPPLFEFEKSQNASLSSKKILK